MVLYEDNHIIVVNKRCGELVQSDPSGAPSLEDRVKSYIKDRYNKSGAVFLGVVHRIDRRVSGAVLFAKTSKALSRLNEQLREGGFRKYYLAVVQNKPHREQARLESYISRNERINKSFVSEEPQRNSKRAVLNYELIASSTSYHLLRVELLTGRHHQIRAQLSSIGCPIAGDVKYGAKRTLRSGGIALHSYTLGFMHPVSKEFIEVVAPMPGEENLWQIFGF